CSSGEQPAGFRAAGVEVFGPSRHGGAVRRQHVHQRGLPYPRLSDETMRLAAVLGLPPFESDGTRYFKRLALILAQEVVEAALYPVFPPEQAAIQALKSITEHP